MYDTGGKRDSFSEQRLLLVVLTWHKFVVLSAIVSYDHSVYTMLASREWRVTHNYKRIYCPWVFLVARFLSTVSQRLGLVRLAEERTRHSQTVRAGHQYTC